MTEVIYIPNELKMIINGHACYAQSGKDIVCAGISTLIFTLTAQLKRMGFEHYTDIDEREGFAMVQARAENPERQKDCMIIFSTVYAGLELLSEHYPEHVKIVREEIKCPCM